MSLNFTKLALNLTHFPTQYRSGQRYGHLTLLARGQASINLSSIDSPSIDPPSFSFSGRLLWHGFWTAACDCGEVLTIHTSRINRAMRKAGYLGKCAEIISTYRASDLNDARLWCDEQEVVGLNATVRRYADPDDYGRRCYVGLAYLMVSGGVGQTEASEVSLACKRCTPGPMRNDRGKPHAYPVTRRSRKPIQLTIVRQTSIQPGTDHGRLTTVVYQVRRGWVCFCNECETYVTVRYSAGLKREAVRKCRRVCGEGDLELLGL
jgi:hypothetical protein